MKELFRKNRKIITPQISKLICTLLWFKVLFGIYISSNDLMSYHFSCNYFEVNITFKLILSIHTNSIFQKMLFHTMK
jgi:hypothetical protein